MSQLTLTCSTLDATKTGRGGLTAGGSGQGRSRRLRSKLSMNNIVGNTHLGHTHIHTHVHRQQMGGQTEGLWWKPGKGEDRKLRQNISRSKVRHCLNELKYLSSHCIILQYLFDAVMCCIYFSTLFLFVMLSEQPTHLLSRKYTFCICKCAMVSEGPCEINFIIT